MNHRLALAALLAGGLLLAGCGRDSNDGSPTAADNEQLNNISEVLDASPDSLVSEGDGLGNGDEPAATGDLPVDNGAANGAVANGQ
jgi:hypothetical protein